MHALAYDNFGGPGEMKLRSAPLPAAPAEGQVLVKVRCAAVNPVDAEQRKGATRALLEYPWPQVATQPAQLAKR